MEIALIPARELSPDLVIAWRNLHSANADLASPYFAPEFTQAVGAVSNDVEVAVLREGGKIAAFFPFQRTKNSLAIPVGGILSDYQGLICGPDFGCDPRELLKKCRLVAWDFDHLLASQRCFARFHREQEASPVMDLSGGYEAYVSERRAAGSEQIKKCGNLLRRLEREKGNVSFICQSSDAACLGQVLAWKSVQYTTGGKRDLFAPGWIRSLVERIHSINELCFSGMLSLLYVGERLVAGHFGMRSRHCWHYWFPSYDEDLAKYSPGLILLLKMAEKAPSIGLSTIDLGKGASLYKERLMNASVSLASGSVELPSWLSFRRGARRNLRTLAERSKLAGPMRRLLRQARNNNRRADF